MNIIEQLEKEQAAELAKKRKIPDFAPGDTLKVNVKVVEGERSRVQAYEGVCIGRAGGGINENFTVRKISYGEGVERVFPVYSPLIESIEVIRRGKVRRAKGDVIVGAQIEGLDLNDFIPATGEHDDRQVLALFANLAQQFEPLHVG